MYSEDELLPISALQHLLYCPRQCALIHLEGEWAENRFTVEGDILHERTDTAPSGNREGVRQVRGMLLRSLELGLSGRADVVEFHAPPGRTRFDRRTWTPFPVEYKRGRPKQADWDRVQLCAQAMCLEEMLGRHIDEGALFYGQQRRRERIAFDDHLRGATRETAFELHILIKQAVTPVPVADERCRACSFAPRCMPSVTGKTGSVAAWITKMLKEQ